LSLFRELEAYRTIVVWVGAIAGHWNAQRQSKHAARLFGAVQALREALRAPVTGIFRAKLHRDVSATRAALAEETFAAAWSAGREMSLEAAISDALREPWDETETDRKRPPL